MCHSRTQAPLWERFVRVATRKHLEPGECNPTPTLTTRSITSAGRRSTPRRRMSRVQPHLWKTEPRQQSVPVKATLDQECHLWHMLQHHDPRGERTSHTRPPRVRLNQEAVCTPANQTSVGQTDSDSKSLEAHMHNATSMTCQTRGVRVACTHPPTTQVIPGKSDPRIPTDAGDEQEQDTPPRCHHSGILTTGHHARPSPSRWCM